MCGESNLLLRKVSGFALRQCFQLGGFKNSKICPLEEKRFRVAVSSAGHRAALFPIFTQFSSRPKSFTAHWFTQYRNQGLDDRRILLGPSHDAVSLSGQPFRHLVQSLGKFVFCVVCRQS